jgi:hypothetical protein
MNKDTRPGAQRLPGHVGAIRAPDLRHARSAKMHRQRNGSLRLAGWEDRAMLESNPSAHAGSEAWRGAGAITRLPSGQSCFGCKASNSGVWGRAPRRCVSCALESKESAP